MQDLLKLTKTTVFANPDQEAKLVDTILNSGVPLQELFRAFENDRLLRQLVVKALVNRVLFCAQITGPNGYGDTNIASTEVLMETISPSTECVAALSFRVDLALLAYFDGQHCFPAVLPNRKEKMESLEAHIQGLQNSCDRGEYKLLYESLLMTTASLRNAYPSVFG